MNKLSLFIQQRMLFFTRTIWQLDRARYSWARWLGIRLLRTLVLSVKGFSRHNSSLRASALTFFTLFSLVPLAAIAFGIAKGFGVERHLQDQILEYFSAQEAVVRQIISFAQNMLNNTRGDMIAGIGVLALFWAVIKVLGNIESAFNHIWGVPSRRPVRKLTDYLTITLICPLLLIVSGSLTVFITSQITVISGRFDAAQVADPLIWLILKLLPFFLSWVLFTLVYMIMPNTRVGFSGALLAGVITGTICQLIQTFYFYFQILMSKYNAIYGSFAALPLFLLWMQLTWLIVLAGAEISHAFQHSEQTDPLVNEKNLSIHQVFLLCLVIFRHVAGRFRDGAPALSPATIGGELGLSASLAAHLTALLVKAGVLVRIETADTDEVAVQPARDISRLTISQVMEALADAGEAGLPLVQSPAVAAMADTLSKMRDVLAQSSVDRLLVDLEHVKKGDLPSHGTPE